VCGEEANRADVAHIRTPGGVDPVRTLARMEDLLLVRVQDHEVQLTERGESAARDVVRRHRLAERLFKDTFRIDDHEAHTQRASSEHIISPELDQPHLLFPGPSHYVPARQSHSAGHCCNHKSEEDAVDPLR